MIFFFRFHFLDLTPPSICTNSAEMQISSNSYERRIKDSDFLRYQVRELISILYDLQNSNISGPSNTESTQLTSYHYSDRVFNLSHRALSKVETKVPEKGLAKSSIHNKINEPKIIDDIKKFCSKMCLNCISVTMLLPNSAKFLLLDLNLRVIHQTITLTWRYF